MLVIASHPRVRGPLCPWSARLALIILVSAAALGCPSPTPTPPPPPPPPTTPDLEASIISPFAGTGVVTSAPPGHHVVFGGDTSWDVALLGGGTGGSMIFFDSNAISPAEQIRGVVLSGGTGDLRYACSSGLYSDGGYAVKIEVQALYQGTWTPLGWVLYAHMDDIHVSDGDVIYPPYTFADATYQYGGTCSTGPHVHMELYNYHNYPCYSWLVATEGNTFGPSDTLGLIGGSITGAATQCP